MKFTRLLLIGYALIYLVALMLLATTEIEILLPLQIVTFPWSLLDLLVRYDTLIIFYALPAYVFNLLFLSWFARKQGKLTGVPHENKQIALLITTGYLVWAGFLIINALVCTGKFCGLLVILALSGFLFVMQFLPSELSFDSEYSLFIFIPLVAFVIYGISRAALRFLNPQVQVPTPRVEV